MMTAPVALNLGIKPAFVPTRRPQVAHSAPEFGAKARQANQSNAVCAIIMLSVGGILAAVTGWGLFKIMMAPAALRPGALESARLVKDQNGAVVPNTYDVLSSVNGADVVNRVSLVANSGFLGMFKKASISTNGQPNGSVRLMFLPPALKRLLKKGPNDVGSPLKFNIIKKPVALGDKTLPARGGIGVNVYGEPIGLYMQGSTFKMLRPQQVGVPDSPYVEETVTVKDLLGFGQLNLG